MTIENSKLVTHQLVQLIESFEDRGVRFWSENGRLYYRGPEGAVTPEDLQRIRQSKLAIIGLLANAKGSDQRGGEIDGRADTFPLTFSQLAHWNLFQLGKNKSMRQVADAICLHGPLVVRFLQHSLAVVTERHHAMRLRIRVRDGMPIQELHDVSVRTIPVYDVTHVPADQKGTETLRRIQEVVWTKVDVAVDPLYNVELVRWSKNDHVLIVAAERIASDGFSLNVILKDLFATYVQLMQRMELELPPVRAQFTDYALSQRSTRDLLERNAVYWGDHLRGMERVCFPEARSVSPNVASAWSEIPVHLGHELTAALRRWCRSKGTTQAMSIFTAYSAVALRWCGVREMVIQYSSDNRVDPQFDATVGWFATVLLLRVQLCEGDSFYDLLNRVTAEYCEAYENADSSYTAAQLPQPGFMRNTCFNWAPQSSSRRDLSILGKLTPPLVTSPFRFPYPMAAHRDIDHEPLLLLFEEKDDVVGHIYFALNRFSAESMRLVACNLLRHLKALVEQPGARVCELALLAR